MHRMHSNRDHAWAQPDRPCIAAVALLGLLLVAALLIPNAARASSPPVAAYSFDEGSGATLTDSAGAYDGAIEGATWTSEGKYGSALEFDGEDDLVSIADAAELDLTESFTLEAWVRPEEGLVNGSSIISKTGANGGYLLNPKTLNAPVAIIGDGEESAVVIGESELPADTWSHLAVTSDGATLRLYIDGEEAANAPALTAGTNEAPLQLGRSQASEKHFAGRIDEVRIYDEVRSEGQIQSDRDMAVGRDQMPIAAYSFDEGEGETLGDSASDHDGTIEGATWTSEGKYGSALEFDGEDDLVSIADAAELDLTNGFTLEAWVRPDEDLQNGTSTLAKADASGTLSGYLLNPKTFNKPIGILADGEGSSAIVGEEQLPSDAWSHLSLTSDGETMRLYVDGEEVATAPALPPTDTTAPLELGRNPANDKHFKGTIDEIRIYDEVIPQLLIQTDRDTRVEPPPATEVTTTALDTGEHSELVESVPITGEGEETTVYSLALPNLKAGETLQISATLELTNKLSYATEDSIALVLGTDPTDPEGYDLVPWTSIVHAPTEYHRTLPIAIHHTVATTLGSRYLKVVVKARAQQPAPADSLTVQPNFGSLSVVRSTPHFNPSAQPTHVLRTHSAQLSLLLNTIPVDSQWRRVLTRKADALSQNDLVDLLSSIAISNNSSGTVELETKITRTGAPSTHGSWAAQPNVTRLGPHTSDRAIHSHVLTVPDPALDYFNLSVRAMPISGNPAPLALASEGANLSLVQHHTAGGNPTTALGEGTAIDHRSDPYANITSLPYATATAPEPRVIASAPLYGGTWKGEIIHARGFVTGDIEQADKAQLLTKIILADSPTDVDGPGIGAFSGDIMRQDSRIRTVFKEGTYVSPQAEGTQYVNLVARASRSPEYPGETMSILAGSVSATQHRPTRPLNLGFENDIAEPTDLLRFDYNGPLHISEDVSREEDSSLHVLMNNLHDYDEDRPGVRRVEARHPDLSAAGAQAGSDRWFGYSVYFPDGFNAPNPAPGPHFDGLLDEVRIYDDALAQEDIVEDSEGHYAGKTPIAAYTFDNDSGPIVEDSANENDGTLSGGASRTPDGKIGSALALDGIDDEVRVPHVEALGLSDSFTIEAWVNPGSLNSPAPILTKSDGADGYRLYAAISNGDALVPLGLLGPVGSLSPIFGDSQLPLNIWTHVALTSDGSSLRLYIDGTLIRTAPMNGFTDTTHRLVLGGPPQPEAPSGRWNIFTQWKAVGEFGCGGSSQTSPPIALGVRYYTAGSHTNPGESQSATPVDGEYLEVRFNGGEVQADCLDTVEPSKVFVLAPLQKNEWYDIVQRVEWTTSTPSPGESVMSLWIDGEEVLGANSMPVQKPTLFWRGTQANRSLRAFPQFGIYRGPSTEDPTSELYFDAIRSGDSFAQVAPR